MIMLRSIAILFASLMPVLASAQISPETILGPPVGIPPNCIGWGNKCAPTTTQWDALFEHKVDVDGAAFNLQNDFGAVCDGSTDDTTAIQAFMNKAAPGVRLVFPAGSPCAFTAPLTFPGYSNVTIDGTGSSGGLLYTGPAVPVGTTITASASGYTLTVTSGTPTLGAYLTGITGFPNVMVTSGSGSTWTLSENVGTVASQSMTTVPPLVKIGTTNTCFNSWNIRGFRMRSSTVMTAGDALQINCISTVGLLDINIGGSGAGSDNNSNFYNALHIIAGSSYHAWHGNLRGSNAAVILQGEYDGAYGVLVDVYMEEMAITNSGYGVIVGGGCGGCNIDASDIEGNGENALISQSYVSTPNLQVLLGSTASVDATSLSLGSGVGVEVSDPGNNVTSSTLDMNGAWLSWAQNQCLLVDNTALYWRIKLASGALQGCGQSGTLATGALDNESTSASMWIRAAGDRFWDNNGNDIYNVSGAVNPIVIEGSDFDSTSGKFSGAVVGSYIGSAGDIYEKAGHDTLILGASGKISVIGTVGDCSLWVEAGTLFSGDSAAGSAGCTFQIGTASYPFTSGAFSGAVSSGSVQVAPVAIGSLPTCGSTLVGREYWVNNGVTSPTYHLAVSSTGTATWPVYCTYNGSAYAWVY